MENEELERYVLQFAQQTAAIADVVAIICGQLSERDPPAASRIASLLNQIADNPDLQATPAFAQMAPWFAQHLLGNQDQAFLSLQKRSDAESGRDALRELLQRMNPP